MAEGVATDQNGTHDVKKASSEKQTGACDVRPGPEKNEPQAAVEPKGVRLRRFSLGHIVFFASFCTVFVGSVLFNISLGFSSGPQFSWVLVAGLLLVTAISLVGSFWHYYIRSIYVKDGPALVPEKWGSIIGDLTKMWGTHHRESQLSIEKIRQSTDSQYKKSSDLLDSFLTLQGALSTRDEEIARLKKGHDAKVFKRFLLRFIRIDRSLIEMEQEFTDTEGRDHYRYLSRLMQDALEECGVEKFLPEIGSDYRDAGPQIADDPTVQTTNDESQDFTISAINSAGYILDGEGEIVVIVPATVSILRFNNS
jgi:hypothetical protein